MTIKIYINDTAFLLEERDMGEIIQNVIPPYLKDNRLPAPDPISDIIRSGIKSVATVGLKKLLFNVYGAKAPKVDKREDKLPVVWRTLIDFMTQKLTSNEVRIYAQETDEGDYRVFKYTTFPVSTTPAGSDEAKAKDSGEPAETLS